MHSKFIAFILLVVHLYHGVVLHSTPADDRSVAENKKEILNLRRGTCTME